MRCAANSNRIKLMQDEAFNGPASEQPLLNLSAKEHAKSLDFEAELSLPRKVTRKLISLISYLDQGVLSRSERQSKTNQLRRKRTKSTFTPRDSQIYRDIYWAAHGQLNTLSILKNLINNRDHEDYQRIVLINEILKNIPEAHPDLRKFDCNRIVFFDADNLWSPGHMAHLEETIMALHESNNEIAKVIIADKVMNLFPEFLYALQARYKSVYICFTDNTPIAFPSREMLCDKLKINDNMLRLKLANLEGYHIQHDSIFNPRLSKNQNKWNSSHTEDSNQLLSVNKYYTKQQSKRYVEKQLRHHFGVTGNNYIVYHSRNSSFKFPSCRDSPSIKQRAGLFEALLSHQMKIIILGINPKEDKYIREGIIYIDEIREAAASNFQMHLINGASSLIGSCSGITHFAYNTSTPLLMIDMPFPYASPIPNNKCKIVLKNIKDENKILDTSNYYKYHCNDYYISDRYSDNPIIREGKKLTYNSNSQVYAAWLELNNLKSKVEDSKPKTNELALKSKLDKQRIDAMIANQKLSGLFSPIPSRYLAESNWLYDKEILKNSAIS